MIYYYSSVVLLLICCIIIDLLYYYSSVVLLLICCIIIDLSYPTDESATHGILASANKHAIVIYHDFLPTPRRGSHVKSDKTHT